MNFFTQIKLFVVGIVALIGGIFWHPVNNYVAAPSTSAQEYQMLEKYGLQNNQELIKQHGLEEFNKFGSNPGTLPNVLANYNDSLAAQMAIADTSFTLTSGQDTLSRNLSGRYCFTIDAQTSLSEFVCGTASGTAISAVTRGIDPLNWNTTSSVLAVIHRRGASVTITDYTSLGAITRMLNGSDTLPFALQYQSHPVGPASTTIVDKNYVDSVATSGAADAGIGSKGLVQIATPAQNASGTATSSDSGATLYYVPTSGDFGATSTARSQGVWTNLLGKISQTFLDLTQQFTFSSGVSSTANTQLATTTFTAGTVDLSNATIVGSSSIPFLASGVVTSTTNFSTSTPNATFMIIGTSTQAASITLTTNAHRVLLNFIGSYQVATTSAQIVNFDFAIDGNRVGGSTEGLEQINILAASNGLSFPISMSYLTGVLSAGSHTFTAQFACTTGVNACPTTGNYFNIFGADPTRAFSATELYSK